MKLANLFLITALVGVVAAIGCSDDPPANGTGGSGGTAGSGGTGGGAADPCTGGLCDSDTQVKTNCQELIAACNDFEGAGGQGGAVDPTDQECDAIGTAYCTSTGGAGGAGGEGGAGGATPVLGCDEGKCTPGSDAQQLCEDFFRACIVVCEGTANPCGEDECLGIGLLWCNIE